jgi:hypothetical protein
VGSEELPGRAFLQKRPPRTPPKNSCMAGGRDGACVGAHGDAPSSVIPAKAGIQALSRRKPGTTPDPGSSPGRRTTGTEAGRYRVKESAVLSFPG